MEEQRTIGAVTYREPGAEHFGQRRLRRTAFGDQDVDRYLDDARTEQALFDKVVTDWERMRYFERG